MNREWLNGDEGLSTNTRCGVVLSYSAVHVIVLSFDKDNE
jgi:hypothetical protein